MGHVDRADLDTRWYRLPGGLPDAAMEAAAQSLTLIKERPFYDQDDHVPETQG
jgi:hypothetical protein